MNNGKGCKKYREEGNCEKCTSKQWSGGPKWAHGTDWCMKYDEQCPLPVIR